MSTFFRLPGPLYSYGPETRIELIGSANRYGMQTNLSQPGSGGFGLRAAFRNEEPSVYMNAGLWDF
ncbi:MAG: hypothetical protein P8M78_00110 [Myxococcota bacterium]|nr:hypothetical protein [Myxococcota bacterium]